MSFPHHGYWDRICLSIDPAPAGFDRKLPAIGKLGRRIRRKRRGLGYVFGNALRTLRIVSNMSLTSRRFRLTLWRRRWALMVSFGLFALWGVVLFLAFRFSSRLESPVFFGVWIVFICAATLITTVRRHELEAWPLMALCRRRCALMHSSARYRRLHVDAGVDQTPTQLSQFIAFRRNHWSQRLSELKYTQRNAFAYREFWWLSLPSLLYIMVFLLPVIPGRHPFFFNQLFLVLLFQAFIFLAPSLLAKRRLGRLRRNLEELSCPDCAYPLADFAVGSWRGSPVQGLGPARCMECGSPWPLIPPPRGRAV